jgi:hypothetical protein
VADPLLLSKLPLPAPLLPPRQSANNAVLKARISNCESLVIGWHGQPLG